MVQIKYPKTLVIIYYFKMSLNSWSYNGREREREMGEGENKYTYNIYMQFACCSVAFNSPRQALRKMKELL